MSVDSASGTDTGGSARGSARGAGTPRRSDEEILSPEPVSPVQVKTAALEKLTGTPTTATRAPATLAGPTSNMRSVSSNVVAAKEIEDLKAKLRVLEKKRLEDREKLRNSEKIQSDRDKFERIIQTLQIKYQPQQQENTDLKKHLKEAQMRLESIEAIQAEHESAMELATLDREMAEETAEVFKMELDALKSKAEELELEVDILREENAEFTNGMSADERASTGWLQMERNNERLREALIRLRDLTEEQEEELKEKIKGLEEDLRELESVKEEFEAAKEKLSRSETAVEDLRQQLDNAEGAEDMIEELTERNASQAEQIDELKAVVEDLESLKEINDELEINHVQNEREMQEEIDFKDSIIAEQARRAAHQDESMEDLEYTLSRFRELVTSLQGDLEDMRASQAVTETESEQLNSRSRAMLDLNMKLQISAAKTQVKTIDLELRRLEAQEAEQHLEIVKLFLPESYQADRDSVLALLRFRRLAFKANLLNGFLKDRVASTQVRPGHEDDIFVGCDAVDKLTWVAAMCDRFVNAISHCSLDEFAKFEGALLELEPVERALNGWIDALRRDELKEKQCADELQRTISLMTHLAEIHIPDDLESYADDIHMKALLMQSHLESAAASFSTAKAMVQRVVPAAAEDEELAQYFTRKADAVVTQTRSAKVIASKAVRALEELKARSLSLLPDTREAFQQCQSMTHDVTELARIIGLDLHKLLNEEGRTEPYTYADVQACAQKTALLSASASETDLFSTYLAKLRIVASQITDLAALCTDLEQTQEFDRTAAPWLLRSQELKALRAVPVDTEDELRRAKEELTEARRAVALYKQELETSALKNETLERRVQDGVSKADRLKEAEAHIEKAKEQAASLRDDIEKQDRELKTLEADRDKWKKIAGDSRVVVGAGADGEAGSKAGQERAVATAREMDALTTEIDDLQAAVRYLREDNRRARLTEQSGLDWLAAPLRAAPTVAETRTALVVAESKDALSELVKMVGSAEVYKLASLPQDKLAWKPARKTPQYHAAKQTEDYAAWRGWQDAVLQKSRMLAQQSSAPAARAEPARSKVMRDAVARLQIRLPGADGAPLKGLGREVQIVGSREWEGLQGRVAVV